MAGGAHNILPGEPAIDPVALERARNALAALDQRVFATAPVIDVNAHLADVSAGIRYLLGDANNHPAPTRGGGAWRLALLADRDCFERHYDVAVMAVADVFTFRTHLNIEQLREAYSVFIESFVEPAPAADYRGFIDMIARLIGSLAGRRIASYSAMIRKREDKLASVALAWPGEVTALVLGAAVYSAEARRLTRTEPAVPLSAPVLQSAAGLVRTTPGAAQKFRELLQLSTPWS